jgi:hypothetical protein
MGGKWNAVERILFFIAWHFDPGKTNARQQYQ